jgi:hypothetical protein
VAQLALEQGVEDFLVLEALLLVDGVDLGAHLIARQPEAGVHHAVNGGLDRRLLHLHEVGEGVVEVENDGTDHARSLRVTRPGAPGKGPGREPP